MSGATVRILGIDPGSRATGYGVIDTESGRSRHVTHGVLRPPETGLPERLHFLFRELASIIAEVRPDEVAIEQVFVRANVASALVLGQVRGAAICAAAESGVPLHEYAPARVKQAITGSGRADKHQMQHMVKVLLNLPARPASDAADALACALCHAHSRTLKLHTVRALHGARR